MNSDERRKKIENILKKNTNPISASSLAKNFSVSRQIIVGDIALMRAAGLKIVSTPRGYILNSNTESDNIFTIACCHDETNMDSELYIIVDSGGTIVDVTVEHPIYGQIVGELHISSRYEADLFLEKVRKNVVQPLFILTDGIHLHTIKCKDKQTFERIKKALKKENILLEKN